MGKSCGEERGGGGGEIRETAPESVCFVEDSREGATNARRASEGG